MVKLLEDIFTKSAPVSEIPIHLEKSGAVRIEVEKYLSSEKGQAELEKAQEQWERSKTTAG